MKKLAAVLFILVHSISSFACTTFLLSKNGQHLFGRNYDWVTGNGMVVINNRGVKKTSFPTGTGAQISWVADCGSITFNQWGKDFPNGGMNEKGLVVELMWLTETQYPEKDERASLDVLQWIQYQLDNCATVEEVIATDKKLRISTESAAPIHYLVADATGKAATIEFLNGKMIVHQGKELSYPVLTNTVYSEAVAQIEKRVQEDTTAALTFTDNSLHRFATACTMVQQFGQVTGPPVDYAFTLLDKVAQGSFTRWRIVYDISARQIHFLTDKMTQRKTVSFTDFDFSCHKTPLFFNLAGPSAGSLKNEFEPLTFARNKQVLEQSREESRGYVSVSDALLKRATGYFMAATCH